MNAPIPNLISATVRLTRMRVKNRHGCIAFGQLCRQIPQPCVQLPALAPHALQRLRQCHRLHALRF